MAEEEPKSTVPANIPYFSHDVIGRMFPGGFFLVGLFLSIQCFLPLYQFDCFLNKETKISEVSLGLATVMVGLGILIFAVTSLFVGFTLGALSHFVERVWKHYSKFTFEGLQAFLGILDITQLKARFKDQFGSEADEDALNKASFLCSYYGWKINPTLGAMQGRWDSDLLAAQSFVLVSLALLLANLGIGLFVVGFDLFRITWSVTLALILLGSAFGFDYHRKKRVYGRFAVFLTLSNNPNDKKVEPAKS